MTATAAGGRTGGGNADPGRTGASSASLRVMLGIVSSRVLGLLREVLVAGLAGVSGATDVLVFAFRGPNLVQNLLGEQALSASFIPIYSRFLAGEREADGRRFAGAVLALLVAAGTVLALLGITLAPLLVRAFAPGFEVGSSRHDIAVDAVRLVFPMASVLVLSAWCLAVLNSHRRFFLPYFAPALWNLSIVATLVFLYLSKRTPDARLLVLTACAAALGGSFLQLAVQLPTTLRCLGGLEARLSLRVPGVSAALAAFGPAMLGRGVLQLSAWLDVVLASFLAPGALAAINFAQRLYQLPLALFGTAVAVVELPELSRQAEPELVRNRIAIAFRRMQFLVMPSALGFLCLGLPIVAAVFGRGRFTALDAWLVYLVLAAYSIAMPANTSARLLQNAFFARHDTRTPALIGLARVAASVAVGLPLMFWLDRLSVSQVAGLPAGAGALRLGALGLAVGSAIGGWVELALLRIAMRRAAAREASPAITLPWRQALLYAALALAAALPAGGTWWLLSARPALLVGPLVLGVFSLLYVALASALRLPEMLTLWRSLATVMRRGQASGAKPGE